MEIVAGPQEYQYYLDQPPDGARRCLPVVVESKCYVREGSYPPETLGLTMPGLKWIHVGYCYLTKNVDPFFHQGAYATAHSHLEWYEGSEQEIIDSGICFVSGASLFSAPKVMTETFLHEYCHILAGSVGNLEEDAGHGPLWAAQMERFGLDPSRYGTYIYR